MKKVFFFLIFCSMSFCRAQSNVQVVLDNGIPLPREVPTSETKMKFVSQGRCPLNDATQKLNIVMMKPTKADGNAQVTFPNPIALVPSGEPLFLPSGVDSLIRYESAVISENPVEYRVISMPLNDFGVAMARKAGLSYIYNPAIRGTVNGVFYNMDPIYMLRLASKANGYRLSIRDGQSVEFEKN